MTNHPPGWRWALSLRATTCHRRRFSCVRCASWTRRITQRRLRWLAAIAIATTGERLASGAVTRCSLAQRIVASLRLAPCQNDDVSMPFPVAGSQPVASRWTSHAKQNAVSRDTIRATRIPRIRRRSLLSRICRCCAISTRCMIRCVVCAALNAISRRRDCRIKDSTGARTRRHD